MHINGRTNSAKRLTGLRANLLATVEIGMKIAFSARDVTIGDVGLRAATQILWRLFLRDFEKATGNFHALSFTRRK